MFFSTQNNEHFQSIPMNVLIELSVSTLLHSKDTCKIWRVELHKQEPPGKKI